MDILTRLAQRNIDIFFSKTGSETGNIKNRELEIIIKITSCLNDVDLFSIFEILEWKLILKKIPKIFWRKRFRKKYKSVEIYQNIEFKIFNYESYLDIIGKIDDMEDRLGQYRQFSLENFAGNDIVVPPQNLGTLMA